MTQPKTVRVATEAYADGAAAAAAAGAQGGVTSVNAKVGAVVLNKTDIGLGNVDNTTDAGKPISSAAQTALDAKLAITTAAATYSPLRDVAATVTAAGALVINKHNPVDATAGALTVTLPTGAPAGTLITVEKEDTSTNIVTVSGSLRAAGASNITLRTQYESMMFQAKTGGTWWPIAGHKTWTALDAAYATTASVAAKVGSDGTVLNIVSLTAAAYAALATKVATTLYVIVG